MTDSSIQRSLERLQVVLHQGDQYKNPHGSIQLNRGQMVGAVQAWLNLPTLVELAIEHGVPREQVDVPRGVFQTPDGTVHWRSDSGCSRRSTYRKLRLTHRDQMCPECAHAQVQGRTGFGTHELLKRLVILADTSAFLESHEGQPLVELGTDIHELRMLVEKATERLQLTVVPSTESTPQIETITEHLRERMEALIEEIAATYTKDEFRKVYEAELEKLYANRSRGDEPWEPSGARREPTESLEPHMLVVREDAWESWIDVARRTYPKLGNVPNWTTTIIIQVPGKVGAQLQVLFPREVLEAPTPMPADPVVVETAIALYSPNDGSKLSKLENAVRAAELV